MAVDDRRRGIRFASLYGPFSIPSASAVAPGFAAFFIIWFLFFALGVASLVFLVLAVVDIARRPERQWRMAAQDRTLWLVLSILIAMPCAYIYWFVIRKRLVRAEKEAAARGFVPGEWGPPPPPAVPAGWWPDPAGPSMERYWDGHRWTEHVRSCQQPQEQP